MLFIDGCPISSNTPKSGAGKGASREAGLVAIRQRSRIEGGAGSEGVSREAGLVEVRERGRITWHGR